MHDTPQEAEEDTRGSSRGERRYRSLADAFGDFVWRMTGDGRLITDVAEWQTVTGQTREQMRGYGWLDGIHPEDRPGVEATFTASAGTRTFFEIEYRVVGPGRERHYRVRAAPVLSPEGALEEWIGTAEDITVSRQAEDRTRALQAELEAERRILERVVEQAPTPIAVLTGPNYVHRFFNDAYLGLVPSGHVRRGMSVSQAFPEADGLLAILDRAYAGELVETRDLAVPSDDVLAFEGNRYFDLTCAPVHDDDRDGRSVGAVAVVAAETTDAVRLRLDLHRRLANERDLAERLQRALVPEALPDLPHVATAVRYRPAGVEVGVGGDWYDAIDLDEGRTLLVIGDVCGRGLEAATAMAQVRAAVRAFALADPRPGAVLEQLARYCTSLGLPDMITLGVGVLDGRTDRLRWASAGHLPPLLVHDDAPPAYVDQDAGPPIGLGGPGAFGEVDVPLGPGSAVVLFTDGLVEERARSLDRSLEDLRLALLDAGAALPRLVTRIDVLAAQRAPGDDVAVLLAAPR